ncbi:hypothetical protein BV455_01601 [Parageobacillus caldoxylosilyticus]|nr:hypothetical protein BV455_01601 [Parageobacillus caldoxylosilyticus]
MGEFTLEVQPLELTKNFSLAKVSQLPNRLNLINIILIQI